MSIDITAAKAYRQFLKDRGTVINLLAPLLFVADNSIADAVLQKIYKTLGEARVKNLANEFKKDDEAKVLGELLLNNVLTASDLNRWVSSHTEMLRTLARRCL